MKNIITIGGGNGHSSILKGLYNHFEKNSLFCDFKITSIVSMSDDGRTTGLLMNEMQEKLGVHMPPPGDIRKCSLALSGSPFKEEFKEVFETIMDFEGDIIDYTLREMLNIMFSFMSFSDLTRKSFREKKFTNLKLNLLKSSDDEKILGSAPENDTFKIDFHVSELEEKKHLINNLELKSEKSFDNEKILKQIQGDRIERFLQYMQNYDGAFLNYILPLKSPIFGHKFGNILMSTLYYNFGDYNRMVDFLGGLLEVKGKVLPVTTDEAFIFAELQSNELIESQDKISNVADYKASVNKINLIRNSKKARLNEGIFDAILEADYIVIGPGDLYTSIDANFLINGFSELIKESSGKKIYILNSNNKRGETTNYDEIDFIDFIQNRVGGELDLIVANSKEPKLTLEEKERFLGDISVKGGRYLFIDEKKKKQIQKKYDKVGFLLGEYIDRKSLYKNNEKMIEDLMGWIGK